MLKAVEAAFIAGRCGEEFPNPRRGCPKHRCNFTCLAHDHTLLQQSGESRLRRSGLEAVPQETFRGCDVREVHNWSSDELGRPT